METGSAAQVAFWIVQILIFNVISGQNHDPVLTVAETSSDRTLRNETSPGKLPNNTSPTGSKQDEANNAGTNQTWIQKLIYEARYNISNLNHQEPRLEYLDFIPEQEPTIITLKPEPYSSETSGNFLVWVSVLGAGCFVCGVLLSSIIALALYRRQRRRWCRGVVCKSNSGADAEHCKPLDSDPHSEYFRFKEGLVSSDVKNALSLLFSKDRPPERCLFQRLNSQSSETAPLCATFSTYKGQTNPFVNQFSGLLSRDEGEISSLTSDVSIWSNEGAIPKGHLYQFFINVALEGNQFGVKKNSQEVQLSPVVELVSPGLKRIEYPRGTKAPLGLWIPHRARLMGVNKRTDWKLVVRYSESPLGDDMVWNDLPEVNSSCRNEPNMYWNWATEYVTISTDRCATFVCVGQRLGDFCPLELRTFIYASLKPVEEDHLRVCQPCLRMYICDNYADGRRGVEQLEYKKAGRCVCEAPLYVYGEHVEITLQHTGDPSWPGLCAESTEKIITWDSLYQYCGVLPALEFPCNPVKGQHPPPSFQATFVVANAGGEPYPIQTNPISIQELLDATHYQEDEVAVVNET